MNLFLIEIGCIAVSIALFLLVRRIKSPMGKACSICGAESNYGYDEYAEDLENIKPMCLRCLVLQLEKEYARFGGRAVIIQPCAGPPCYVFQPVEEWRKHFKESKITDDVLSLLASMEPKCHDCQQRANYLFIESKGLTEDNFTEILDKGPSETLLQQNPKPISLCPKCCIRHIARELEMNHISYLEVCSPRGNGDGFVIPMAY
jgi:hypothetical protein